MQDEEGREKKMKCLVNELNCYIKKDIKCPSIAKYVVWLLQVAVSILTHSCSARLIAFKRTETGLMLVMELYDKSLRVC